MGQRVRVFVVKSRAWEAGRQAFYGDARCVCSTRTVWYPPASLYLVILYSIHYRPRYTRVPYVPGYCVEYPGKLILLIHTYIKVH